MIARYDLSQELVTFDFYCWLVAAVKYGAEEIVFDTRGLRKEHVRRFETIVLPGPAFAGLSCREGTDGERLPTGKHTKFKLPHFVAEAKAGSLPRLHSVLAPKNERYTVTLRDTLTQPYRNSDEKVWREFASNIGAVVIEDYDVKPIDIYTRVALYAGAEMNFGVISGPLILCSVTEYPCMMFDVGLGPQLNKLVLSGLVPGENFPWCGKNQFALWEPDTIENLEIRVGSMKGRVI